MAYTVTIVQSLADLPMSARRVNLRKNREIKSLATLGVEGLLFRVQEDIDVSKRPPYYVDDEYLAWLRTLGDTPRSIAVAWRATTDWLAVKDISYPEFGTWLYKQIRLDTVEWKRVGGSLCIKGAHEGHLRDIFREENRAAMDAARAAKEAAQEAEEVEEEADQGLDDVESLSALIGLIKDSEVCKARKLCSIERDVRTLQDDLAAIRVGIESMAAVLLSWAKEKGPGAELLAWAGQMAENQGKIVTLLEDLKRQHAETQLPLFGLEDALHRDNGDEGEQEAPNG
jgi:hypothetical protein